MSGASPFEGQTGYEDAPYTFQQQSVEFRSPNWQSEFVNMSFGLDGQSRLLVERGTVLSLTSIGSSTAGVLLKSLTVSAVPEPTGLAIAFIALAAAPRRRA